MPPWVSVDQKDAALDRIRRRHRDDDASYAHLLNEDPWDVLRYLRRRGSAGLLDDADRHDIQDALDVRLWLWWQGEILEVWLLETAATLGLRRSDIGSRLGVTTSQGFVDRLRYKQELLSRGDPARQGRPPAPRGSESDTAIESWLRIHRRDIRGTAAILLEHENLVDDDDVIDWLDEVRRDFTDEVCTVGSVALLSLAADALAGVLRCSAPRWRPPAPRGPPAMVVAASHDALLGRASFDGGNARLVGSVQRAGRLPTGNRGSTTRHGNDCPRAIAVQRPGTATIAHGQSRFNDPARQRLPTGNRGCSPSQTPDDRCWVRESRSFSSARLVCTVCAEPLTCSHPEYRGTVPREVYGVE